MDNSALVNNISTRLCSSIAQQWSATMADRCVLAVGLSGGIDSVVLLHLLTQLRQFLPIQLSAIHVHHGLSQYADQWLAFCQQLCADWSVPLQSVRVKVNAKGDGLEAAARKARYQVYAQSKADAVVLAHHRNDQVETFFLGGLRGGGIRALAAMPAQRVLSKHNIIWRPLLSFSRQELEEYAQALGLPYIEDDSNADTTYLRNWLRLSGLPQWRQRLPNLDNQIEAAVNRLQDELALLEEITTEDWNRIHAQQQGFQIPVWRELSELRRKQQLRLFTSKHNLGMSSSAALNEFARQLMENKIGAQWSLPAANVLFYDNKLWIDRLNNRQQWPWLALLPVRNQQLVTSGYLQWLQTPFGLAEIAPDWIVRFCNSSDKIKMGGIHKSVKKLLQERKIPPFLRRIWPVLCNAENNCIAVVNVAVTSDMRVVGGWMPLIKDLPEKI